MRCLVTGASGSVGSRIVHRLLEQGHEVRALVRPTSGRQYLGDERIERVIGDMTDRASLEKACQGVEWLFHAAAPVDDWLPAEVFKNANVTGTKHLIEACKKAPLNRLVFISSVNVYGVQPPPNTSAETPMAPCGYPYCDTKIEAENLFMAAYREQGLPVSILRPANIWGPTANAWTIRPVQQLLAGEVRLINHGRGSFNPIYVDNLADACLLAAEKQEAVGEAFVLTDGILGMTFKDIFEILADMVGAPKVTASVPKWFALIAAFGYEQLSKITGKRPRVTRFVVEMLTKECYYDTAKTQEVLGYKPRISFEQGLEETKAWLREQGYGTQVED